MIAPTEVEGGVGCDGERRLPELLIEVLQRNRPAGGVFAEQLIVPCQPQGLSIMRVVAQSKGQPHTTARAYRARQQMSFPKATGALGQFNRGRAAPVDDRTGLHLGEVVMGASESGPGKVNGMQVDTCARVMSLAQGGQVLITRSGANRLRCGHAPSIKQGLPDGPGASAAMVPGPAPLRWRDRGLPRGPLPSGSRGSFCKPLAERSVWPGRPRGQWGRGKAARTRSGEERRRKTTHEGASAGEPSPAVFREAGSRGARKPASLGDGGCWLFFRLEDDSRTQSMQVFKRLRQIAQEEQHC